mgnify:CR=1 FL=1
MASMHCGFGLKDWAQKVQGRISRNKATYTLANKLARIWYAVLLNHEPDSREVGSSAEAAAGAD